MKRMIGLLMMVGLVASVCALLLKTDSQGNIGLDE
jgi:hypothetical protein